MNKEALHVEEYITVEDVIKSKNIMMIGGEEGVFFINLDPWETPIRSKEWYKFSINPFDEDFLKFRRMEEGFVKYTVGSYRKIYSAAKYVNLSSNIRKLTINIALLTVAFFAGGNDLKDSVDNFNRVNTNDKDIPYETFYAIKNKFKKRIIEWLENVFREYNNLDNSIEYIKEYYFNWVILVDTIQKINNRAKYHILWRLIVRHGIHSINDFKTVWNNPDYKEELKGLGKDKETIENLLIHSERRNRIRDKAEEIAEIRRGVV